MSKLLNETKKSMLFSLQLFISMLLISCSSGGGGDDTGNTGSSPTSYTINASAGTGGTIDPSGAVSVDHGNDQTFTITPDTGFAVADVLVDGSSQGAITSYTFTNITGDHTISVTFALSGKAVLGPLSGATVEVFEVTDLTTAVYSTTATSSSDLATAGTFTIPLGTLSDATMYLVMVSGGEDIDVDDDGVVDGPTPNGGIIRLVATGADLNQGGFTVNMLTELAYFQAAYQIMTGGANETILSILNRTAGLLLNSVADPDTGDLNNDGSVDYLDLAHFDPVNDQDALRQGWSALGPYITVVLNGESYAGETGIKLSGTLGNIDTSGFAKNVALSTGGTHALVADGYDGLHSFDVTDPFNPSPGGSVTSSNFSYDLAVSGVHAFVAEGTGGIHAVDISSPGAPTKEATSISVAGTAMQGVAVSGNYVFVSYDVTASAGVAGLRVINISDPAAMVGAGSTSITGDGQDVVVDANGDYAYVASGPGGLQVVNIQTPASPFPAGSEAIAGNATGVALSSDGSYAFVTDDTGYLQVIGITDPTDPDTPIQVPLTGRANGVTVSGDRAYVACGYAGIQVLDVSDPTVPVILGFVDTSYRAQNATVSGTLIYVADADDGLQVLDVTTPVPSAATGCVSVPSQAYSVAVSGNTAFVGELDYVISSIDISDPFDPSVNVSIDDGSRTGNGVAVSGSSAFVAFSSPSDSGLKVYDISSPAAPSEDDSLVTDDITFDVAVAGNYAYLADQDEAAHATAGIRVINVTDPTNISLETTVPTPGFSYGVTVSGNYLYVADGFEGLQVMSLSNPAAPTIVGEVAISGEFAHGVAVSGDYAYVAYLHIGLVAINISDPTDPVLASTVDTPEGAERVAILDDYAYVADHFGGIQIIDISDPTAMSAAGYIDTPGEALDVDVDSTYVYVADEAGGLQIFNAY